MISFDKIRINECVCSYFPSSIIVILFSFLLTFKSNNLAIFVPAQCLIIYIYYYFSHRFWHLVDSNIIFNPHLYYHHEKRLDINRNLELLIDLFFEISLCLPILFFQYMLNTWLIPPTILFFMFTTLGISHLFSYSILGSDIHRDHHLDSTKNFGPDFIDHLFGTNSKYYYEDMNQHIPCAVMGALIVHFAKLYFQWKD